MSCASSRACMAVGFYFDNEAGLARLPSAGMARPGRSSGLPLGSKPASSTACRARRALTAPLWVAAPMHSPRGGTVSAGRLTRAYFGELDRSYCGVSCLSAGTCAAVGADDIGLLRVRIQRLLRPDVWVLEVRPLVAAAASESRLLQQQRQWRRERPERGLVHVARGVHRGRHRWSTAGTAAAGRRSRRRTAATRSMECPARSTHCLHGGRFRTLTPGTVVTGRACRSPGPRRPQRAGLSSVSCMSQASCVAVGTYARPQGSNDRFAGRVSTGNWER